MRTDSTSSPPPPGADDSGAAGRFVVVTGCHGVGKSTVARALSEALGATVVHFPPAFTRFRVEVDLDAAVAPLPRLLYYLGATLHLSDLVREGLAAGPVICDRYLESPYALLLASGDLPEAEMERLGAPFLPPLCVPDLTLLLTAEYEVACRRIRQRGPTRSATQRLALESPAFYHAWEAALRVEAARLGPAVEVDTTALSVAAMCDAARALVDAR